ncbi:MAG: gamma-glutamylcyclotransferase family protein [Thermoplasmata archaeon]
MTNRDERAGEAGLTTKRREPKGDQPLDRSFYFAYGSNMDLARLHRRRIHPQAEPKGAILPGYSLKFNKMASADPNEGFANIVVETGQQTEGVLLQVSTADLDRLDLYEGARIGHYRRIQVRVKLDDGSEIEATTYEANPAWVKSGLKPKREYLGHLLAARSLLSPEHIRSLERVETID